MWALIPQQWENAAWQSGPEIDRQKSQAQALVHAGAWLAGLGRRATPEEQFKAVYSSVFGK